MDPVASGQAAPAAGAASGIPGAFVPGQVLSARVVQALLGDTYLVAVRGLTLVAQSPEPLTPDTVVRLAVLDGSDATGGGPLRVRLMPPGSESPLPTPSAAPAAADPAGEILAMARRLGLPPGPVSELVVAAFHNAGAPLTPPLVRQALRLVQAAVDPASVAPAAEEASRGTEPEPAQTSAAPPPAAPGRSTLPPAATAIPQRLSHEADHDTPAPAAPRSASSEAVAPTAPRSAPPEAPAPGARPVVSAHTPVVTEGVPAPVVKSAPTSTPLPPAAPQPLVESRAPQSQTPQAPMPGVGAGNQPEADAGSVRPPAAPVASVASAPGVSAPVVPVLRGESQRPQSPGVAPSVPLSPMPTVSAPSLKPGSPLVVTTSPGPTAEPAERMPVRPLAAGYVDASLPLRRAAQVGWAATAAPLRESPEVLRLAATAPPAVVANATARLATSPLPLTAATLSVALEAVRTRLPTAAAALPAAAAPASLTNLPARELVDLGAGEPRSAARTGLLLAGIRPGPEALPAAGADALPLDERTLLRHLLRLSLSVGADRTATTATRATSAAPAADTAGRAPEAAAPRAPLPEIGGERPPAPAATPQPFTPAAAAEPLVALREAVAQDLLPPKDLADYDRVIALPLAINGQPLPARLAVTTRPTPTGGTACWMRVDCQLSRLGSVSVRLGGTDVGPVAITLVASPAAAPLLAEALPALAEDLRVVGVDAALRVAIEEP